MKRSPASRSLSISNAAIRSSDAVRWHETGLQGLERDDSDRALYAFRQAARIDRQDRDILVSLARALRAAREDAEAVDVLEALRQTRPEDAEVLTELARLEAERGGLPLAIRYYQDALDTMWIPEAAEQRRLVRPEFISLLLGHDERARALSQVLVLVADLPPEPDWQLRAGRLFLDAGDARRYLGATTSTDPQIVELKQVADLVFAADPLAVRLSRTERERRLQSILDHAGGRLERCGGAAGDADPARAGLRTDLLALQPTPRPRGRAQPDERDRIEDAVELALRVELATATCGPTDALGRVIPIIARLRGLEATG